MRLSLLAFLFLMAASSAAPAGVIGSFVPVPDDGGVAPPSGFVTSDLAIESTTDWLAANLILDLTAGSIYQDALIAGIGPPSQALINAFPVSRFDTYLTGLSGLVGGAPSSAGGAVDIGGSPLGAFGEDAVNVNWFTTSTTDIGDFTIGRFTLSDDAVGTFLLRLDSLGQASPFYLTGSIAGGEFVPVPEAGSLALAALASAGVLAVHWRGRSRRRSSNINA